MKSKSMLARALALLGRLGIKAADQGEILRTVGQQMHRPSKHIGKRTTRLQGQRSRCKLKISRGAGSISAKADITRLCDAGWYPDARLMAIEHERQCGEKLFANAWWRDPE